MIRLAGRINQLERYLRTRECPVCKGEGKEVYVSLYEDEPMPELDGCPGCGKVNPMIIRYVEESANVGGAVRRGKFDGTVTGEHLARLHSIYRHAKVPEESPT